MGKITTKIINTFNGGIIEDRRINSSNSFSLAKNFDSKTFPKKLVPINDFEVAEDNYPGSGGLYKNAKFGVGERATGVWELFTFGKDSEGGATAQVYYHDGDDWQTPANAKSSTGTRVDDVFFYYKGYFYMFGGTNSLKRFKADSSEAFNDSYQTISFTSVAQPVHHPNDDNAYFFINNIVYRLNDTTWDGAVLTLPADLKIMCACNHGNYLAIACTTKDANNPKSVVYLWDRDSSLETLTDRIDLYNGTVFQIASLSGSLITLSAYGKTVIVRNGASVVNKIISDSEITVPERTNQIIDDVLYFPLSAVRGVDNRRGIWSVDGNGRINNEIYLASDSPILGMIKYGDKWWLATEDEKTLRNTEDYSDVTPAIYETLIQGNGVNTIKLVALGVTGDGDFLASRVVLSYRKKEDNLWTEVFDVSNSSDSFIERVCDSSGDALPNCKEYQLQVKSYGGAVITGIVIKYEVIPDGIGE